MSPRRNENYRKNVNRFSRTEDLMLGILNEFEILGDIKAMEIVKKHLDKAIKEEEDKIKTRKRRGKK